MLTGIRKNKTYVILIFSGMVLFLISCSRRMAPSGQPKIVYNADSHVAKSHVVVADEKAGGDVPETLPVAKSEPPKETKQVVEVKRAEASFPKSIYVNDAAATKSVDGRMYYDVEGHRYWKNFRDGKYYLFNKSMYNNPDFTPPSGKGK